MENNQGGWDQNALGNLFQTMFGGGRRRRGGVPTVGQQWLQPGGGALRPYVPQYGAGSDGINGYDYGGQAPQYAGQYGYIWHGDTPVAYDPNLGVPAGYSVFHQGQGALNGLPGIGTPAGGQGYGGGQGGQRGQRGGQPAITGGTHYRGGPAGAPWFANADGTVSAFGHGAPDIGGNYGVNPSSPNWIAPGQPGGAATIPWQGSWADPNSPNFYLAQYGLQTPSDYLNPGQWQWGQGPAMNSGYGNQGPSFGPPGSPMTQGPQGGPPPGAQGGAPPSYPPGGNGPTGPAAPPTAPASNLPSGFQMGPNGQVGNFNMYAGMPYAGGMGPYSGWLPPDVGTTVDYGQPGAASSPYDALTATQAGVPYTTPNPTVQPGQYANLGPANLGMPNNAWGGGGGPWG